MVHSGEIVNLIIRDEAVHGLYIGMLFQDLIKKEMAGGGAATIEIEVKKFMIELMELELQFINELYEGDEQLINEAKTYLEYNANKALQNLGYEPYYKTKAEDVNPIIFKGIDTGTKNHDFFSTKGNGYIKPLKIEDLTDDDFDF